MNEKKKALCFDSLLQSKTVIDVHQFPENHSPQENREVQRCLYSLGVSSVSWDLVGKL